MPIPQILDQIDNTINDFLDGLPESQKIIYDKVLALSKQLDVDGSGKVKNNITNIRILQSINSIIHDVIMTDDYRKKIKAFTDGYNELSQLQNKYLATVFTTFKPNQTLAEITQASMDITADQLGDSGLSNDLANEIKSVLQTNITSGATYSDLTDQLKTAIMGNDQIDGALLRYAKTYTTDSINQFNATYNRQVTSDFKAKWFRYTGSNRATTRPFCEHLTGKDQGYFNIEEVPGFLEGIVGDETVPLYDKTGLPEGMKDGTTEDTFFTLRGGWNCNHQIFPVSKTSVPASLRAKFS